MKNPNNMFHKKNSTLYKNKKIKYKTREYFIENYFQLKHKHSPDEESFVAICDMLLKFHNLPAKFACSFNGYIIHQTKQFSPFYLKHSI